MTIKDENIISFLEEHIPELAEAALKQAYWQALTGNVILEAKDGFLFETHPDGTKKVIKKIPLPTPATPGQKIELQ